MFKVFFSFLILLFLSSSCGLAGEIGGIMGIVTDSATGEPIPRVSVMILNTKLGALTDANGEFMIRQIKTGSCSLRVTCVGYKSKDLADIIIEPYITIRLHIELNKQNTLSEIIRVTSIKRMGNRNLIELKSENWIMEPDEYYAWIPKKYTCDGDNGSPPFEILNVSNGVKSLIIICNVEYNRDDIRTHWVICNIPPDITKIPENIEKIFRPSLGQSATDIRPIQGINDFGEIGYTGPCPPTGSIYRYHFRIYALNKVLIFSERMIKNGITSKDLQKRMRRCVVSRNTLIGKYSRPVGTLKGIVTNSLTNEFICGASLISSDGEFQVCTNAEGGFSSDKITPGCYSLSIEKVGYEDKILSDIIVVEDSLTILEISLTPKEYMHANSSIGRRDWDAPDQLKDPPVFKSVFKRVDTIPVKYTCDGDNMSPPFYVDQIPPYAKSLAIICSDYNGGDGGKWIHWILFNIPADMNVLPENIEKVIFPDVGVKTTEMQPIQGINDFDQIGYDGPCPHGKSPHRYSFRLYALDAILEFDKNVIDSGITNIMLLSKMNDHILAERWFDCIYKRRGYNE